MRHGRRFGATSPDLNQTQEEDCQENSGQENVPGATRAIKKFLLTRRCTRQFFLSLFTTKERMSSKLSNPTIVFKSGLFVQFEESKS